MMMNGASRRRREREENYRSAYRAERKTIRVYPMQNYATSNVISKEKDNPSVDQANIQKKEIVSQKDVVPETTDQSQKPLEKSSVKPIVIPPPVNDQWKQYYESKGVTFDTKATKEKESKCCVIL